MIEMNCATCGEKARIQSFLTASQQTCVRCGHPLMGGAASSGSGPAWSQPSSGGMGTGIFVGILVGLALVAGISQMGRAVPLAVQGAILGALAAVLLAPVLAISSFLSMMFLPFSLEGILGDGIWGRLARANNERSLAPLLFPFFYLVGLPMALGGFGGWHLQVLETPLVIGAGLGAVILGAIFGAVGGSLLGSRRQHV